MDVKVGSWNIYIFGDRNAEGMAKTIEENDIDVIGIQEAGVYFDQDEKFNIVEEIADKLGYNFEFAEAMDFRNYDSERKHKLGNAIISRYPISNIETYSLNPDGVSYDGNPENEPRIALKCDLEIDGEEITFLTTHLQYTNEFTSSDIRENEIKELLKIMSDQENPFILAGDFNCNQQNKERRLLEAKFESLQDDSPTWTVIPFDYNGWQVDDLDYRVDEIYYSKEFDEISSSTIYSEISDHLPITATLKLN